MSSHLAFFLELKGSTKIASSVTPLPHVNEYIYTFLSCSCREGARSLHVLQGPIQVSYMSRQKLRSTWPQAQK